MKKTVKIRLVLFFVAAALCACSAIGELVLLVLSASGTLDVLLVKVCLITNVITFACALVQAYYLLKLLYIN